MVFVLDQENSFEIWSDVVGYKYQSYLNFMNIFTMKSAHKIKALCYNKATIRTEPEFAEALERFAKADEIPWNGQSIGGLMAETFRRQMQPSRKRVPASVRREVEERQGGECAMSGDRR